MTNNNQNKKTYVKSLESSELADVHGGIAPVLIGVGIAAGIGGGFAGGYALSRIFG